MFFLYFAVLDIICGELYPHFQSYDVLLPVFVHGIAIQ